MALIDCSECDNKISATARACPKCGAKVAKKAGLTAWLVMSLIAVGVVSVSLQQQENDSAAAALESAKTPEQRAADAAEQLAETLRVQAAAGFIDTLKRKAREPESLVIETIKVNDDSSVLCAEYRARNGFGGMNRERVVVTHRINSQRASDWNTYCPSAMNDMHWVTRL